jgi:hypothetical protein
MIDEGEFMTSTDRHSAEQLFNDVSNWVSHQNGWHSQSEVLDGDDQRPSLRIDTNNQERVHLELLGRHADGSLVVEMYAWPTLVRVRLRSRPDHYGWKVVTDGGVPILRDWNERNFVELVHDLTHSQ